jgi:hypothetical protein
MDLLNNDLPKRLQSRSAGCRLLPTAASRLPAPDRRGPPGFLTAPDQQRSAPAEREALGADRPGLSDGAHPGCAARAAARRVAPGAHPAGACSCDAELPAAAYFLYGQSALWQTPAPRVLAGRPGRTRGKPGSVAGLAFNPPRYWMRLPGLISREAGWPPSVSAGCQDWDSACWRRRPSVGELEEFCWRRRCGSALAR